MTHSWLGMIQTSVGSIVRNLEGTWDDWHRWLSDLPALASTLLDKKRRVSLARSRSSKIIHTYLVSWPHRVESPSLLAKRDKELSSNTEGLVVITLRPGD